jgi:hypothetical protein
MSGGRWIGKYSLSVGILLVLIMISDQSINNIIRVAQRKRGGPITHRSQDRNLALISLYFFHFFAHGLIPEFAVDFP